MRRSSRPIWRASSSSWRAVAIPPRSPGVASFFVSRIDVAVDALIAEQTRQPDRAGHDALNGLRGKVAIANAKLAYQRYKRLFAGPRWEKLKAKGAQVQRLLWASTGTKNPAYSDVLYVEELIAPDTVNTLPPATMDAFRDHGKVRASLEENVDQAKKTMAALERSGISIDAVTAKLVDEGVALFAAAFDKLLGAVSRKRALRLGEQFDSQACQLAPERDKAVTTSLESWRRDAKGRRPWAADASLWSSSDEAKWLGWLGIAEVERERIDALAALAEDIRRQGFTHVVLLGMGGSSLGPEVFAQTFGRQTGALPCWCSIPPDPAQIRPSKAKSIRPHPVHRIEQIRQHAGAEYPEAIFFRMREAGGRLPECWIALHRHHGSGIAAGEDRRAR